MLARVFKERSCYGKSCMQLLGLINAISHKCDFMWFLAPVLSLKMPSFIRYGEKKGQIVSAQQTPTNIDQAKWGRMLNPRMSLHAYSTGALLFLLCICPGFPPGVWLKGAWAKVERALKEASYHTGQCQSCRMMWDGFGWRLFHTEDFIKSLHVTFSYFIL